MVDLVQDADTIFRAALDAVRPAVLMRRMVRVEGDRLLAGDRSYALAGGSVRVVGGGKAAAAMAAALEEILGDRIAEGIVAVKDGHAVPARTVRVREAGHPIPDARGAAAAEEVLAAASATREGDLLIVLLSGGASALLTLPVEGVSLDDKRRATDLLLRAGAPIGALNTVRKHLSRVKGGRLARAAARGRVAGLILSDVIGDRLDVIASGPTVPDPTTYADALAVLDRYDPRGEAPPAVRGYLQGGAAGRHPETPKPQAPGSGGVANAIIGHNFDALLAARDAAEGLGYGARVISPDVEGEARGVAREHAAIARGIRERGEPVAPPACVLSGGETTVTVHGKGKGGRNTESALAFAIAAEGLAGVAGLFAGTDGTDGPTDAAGAIADGETASRARARGLDPQAFLDANDSYTFFERAGGLIRTGPTLTNVMDLRVVLVE